MQNKTSRHRRTARIDLAELRARTHPDKVVLLAAQVAMLSAISVEKLARMRSNGKGPRAERFGRHYLYRLPEVLAWIDGQALFGTEAHRGACDR